MNNFKLLIQENSFQDEKVFLSKEDINKIKKIKPKHLKVDDYLSLIFINWFYKNCF